MGFLEGGSMVLYFLLDGAEAWPVSSFVINWGLYVMSMPNRTMEPTVVFGMEGEVHVHVQVHVQV